MSSRARATAAVALVAAALLLSACQNLPRRTAGTRCTVVGQHAQDGTWVLRCGTNKRWTKVMTIDQANQAVGDWLRAHAPATTAATTTPTTTAAPGPVTSFTALATDTPVAERAGAVRPGRYTTVVPNGSDCEVYVTMAGVRRVRGNSAGPLYMDLPEGTAVSSAGPCTWTLGEPATVQTMPVNGNGMYRVGKEIAVGTYLATGSDNCYWETATDATATLAAVTDGHFGPGPQRIIVDSTDRFLDVEDCGPLTPLSEPARYLEVHASRATPVWQGRRSFYQGAAVTTTATATAVSARADGYGITLTAPTGTPFDLGDLPLAATADASHLGVALSGPAGGSCTTISGASRVLEVALGLDGAPLAMKVVVVGYCDGQIFAATVRF